MLFLRSCLVIALLFSCSESVPDADSKGDVAVRERDCSHLKGRLYADCRCAGALPQVRSTWGEGEVMAAVAAAESCDKSSPGLAVKDRVLLHAVHASASRVLSGFELARKGKFLDAGYELAEMFAEVEKVPETPPGLLYGPLAYAQCRWFVLAFRYETVAGMPLHSRTVILAKRVAQVCADTLSHVLASNSSSSCTYHGQNVADDYYGYADTFPDTREHTNDKGDQQNRDGSWLAWPQSVGSWQSLGSWQRPAIPWLLAARLASLIAVDNAMQAVKEARLKGAVFAQEGLGPNLMVSHFLSPPCVVSSSNYSTLHDANSNSTLHTRMQLTNLYDLLSLLMCNRLRGLRLRICEAGSFARLSPLFSRLSPFFSARAGLPVAPEFKVDTDKTDSATQAHCRNGDRERKWHQRFWRRFSWRPLMPSAAFARDVLADVWGQAIALECIHRLGQHDVTLEVPEAILKEVRRRCFREARQVTQHVASPSALALAAHALDEFEQGETHAFLRAMTLLLECHAAHTHTDTTYERHLQRCSQSRTCCGGRATERGEPEEARGEPEDAGTGYAASRSDGGGGGRDGGGGGGDAGAGGVHFTSRIEGIVGTIISRAKAIGRHALGGVFGEGLLWLHRMMPEQRTLPQDSQHRSPHTSRLAAISNGFWRTLVCKALESAGANRRTLNWQLVARSSVRPLQHLLVCRIQALLEADELSEALATAQALLAAQAEASADESEPAPAGAFYSRRALAQVERALTLLADAAHALDEAERNEAHEARVLARASRSDASLDDARLWLRERKWRNGTRSLHAAAEHARLRVLHTQRAKEALTAVTVAVDSLASLGAAPPAASEASDNPVAWVARQSAALLGVAVEVERARLLLTARVLRLTADASMCVHISLHALALQQGRLRWLDDSSAAARIKDSVGDLEIKAAAHRLDAYLAFGHKSLKVLRRRESVRRTGDPAPRPRMTMGVVWGMEVLSDCLEGLQVSGDARLAPPCPRGAPPCPRGAESGEHDAHAWRHTRLPMLKDCAIILAQSLRLMKPDRNVVLALKLDAVRVSAELAWQLHASRPASAAVGRLLRQLVGRLGGEIAVMMQRLCVLVPLRTVAQTLLWLRSGASKHMLRARDALRAGLSRAQEWVHSRGPERLRLRLCAGVRSTGEKFIECINSIRSLFKRWYAVWGYRSKCYYEGARDWGNELKASMSHSFQRCYRLLGRARERTVRWKRWGKRWRQKWEQGAGEQWRRFTSFIRSTPEMWGQVVGSMGEVWEGFLGRIAEVWEQVKAQAERGEAQGRSNHNASDEKRRQRRRYEAQQRQKSAQQNAKNTQQNVGGGKSRCNHAFRGLSDGGVMRMFSDGKFIGLATCTRQSARRTFHDYSLQYHPDKAAKNKMDPRCAEENFMDLQAAYARAQALC